MNEPKFKTTPEQLKEITELVEDTVSHLCNENTISGEMVWSAIECLSIAKQCQIQGLIN